MSESSHSLHRRAGLCLLAAGILGCAAPSGRVSKCICPRPSPDAARPAATAHFDERRDDMQFELAEARWRRNELPICQQMLEEVVARNPAHRLANLRLAELYLSANQPRQALGLMQRFCRAHRDDAEAHHLLGVSYEAMGQADRALAAYDVAVSLDPDDPLVRTSLENALAAHEGHGPELLPARSGDSPGVATTTDTSADVN